MRTLPYDLRETIKKRKPFVVLFELDHPVDGIIRLCSKTSDVFYGGNTWLGVGHLGQISGIGGAKNLAVRTLTIEFKGIPNIGLTYLETSLRDRPARAWLAALKDRSNVVKGTPHKIVEGLCDQQSISTQPNGTSTVRVSVIEPIFQIERAQELVWSPEWIRGKYGSNISGLDMLPELTQSNISWTRT